MAATTSSKSARMIWGLSLHGWEDVMRGSLAVVGVSGLIVGLSTFFVVKLQREEIAQSKQEFELYKIESGKQADELKRDTAEANARALESKVELEKFKAPRDLTPPARLAVVERARQFSGVTFDTGAASTDPEQLFLLKQITEALKEADWINVPWNGPGQVIGGTDGPTQGIASISGIGIFVNPDAPPALWDAVMALTAVLDDPGGLAANAGRMAVSGNTNTTAIHVMVGAKR